MSRMYVIWKIFQWFVDFLVWLFGNESLLTSFYSLVLLRVPLNGSFFNFDASQFASLESRYFLIWVVWNSYSRIWIALKTDVSQFVSFENQCFPIWTAYKLISKNSNREDWIFSEIHGHKFDFLQNLLLLLQLNSIRNRHNPILGTAVCTLCSNIPTRDHEKTYSICKD